MFVLKYSITILLVITTILSLDLRLKAQINNKNDIPISNEHSEILEKRKALIEKEIALSKDEWTGVYLNGDHHPTVLMWSYKEGFLTWGSNHTFYPSRINFGKVEFSNNLLTIKPEIKKENLNFQFIPTELFPIKWGEQHFLIPANEIINFAYSVHSQSFSQIESYFLKSNDYQKSRNGLPNLPPEYSKFLKMKPIRPQILKVKIDKEDFWATEITLNLGSRDKIIKEMIFYNGNSKNGISLMITELKETNSKAKIIGVYGEDEPILRKGLVFTSVVPKNFMELP